MRRNMCLLLVIINVFFSSLIFLTKTKYSIIQNSVGEYFKASIYDNLVYLQNSQEICVNYEDYKKDFSSCLNMFDFVNNVESRYVNCPNYIYPIYADEVSEKIQIKSGLIGHSFWLTCNIKRINSK